MPVEDWVPNFVPILLKSHPTARNQATAKTNIAAGSTLIVVPSFESVLLESEKGRRCDNCFRFPKEGSRLLKCTGCASCWYCNTQCQNEQWRAHHKRLCKKYNQFMSSSAFQGLQPHERMDSLLLSHLIARLSTTAYSSAHSTTFSIFLSLLKSPFLNEHIPPICPVTPPPPEGLAENIYSRFGNNNFAIHSHLSTIGHGIFPIASRLFNHSCMPNAVVKYTLSPANVVAMEVVALRDIPPGQEICIPYIDPALLQSRRRIFNLTYGFCCDCFACLFLRQLGIPPKPPVVLSRLAELAKILQDFVNLDDYLQSGKFRSKALDTLPQTLHCILDESYMTSLSESFSRSSHEGQYDEASDAGTTLLALYLLVYPQNYPQIGMHLLEMAKTEWNHNFVALDLRGESHAKQQVGNLLALARRNLEIMGKEGDEDGPFQEIRLLQDLLDNA